MNWGVDIFVRKLETLRKSVIKTYTIITLGGSTFYAKCDLIVTHHGEKSEEHFRDRLGAPAVVAEYERVEGG